MSSFVHTTSVADVINYFQMRLLAGGDATGLTIADFDLTYTRSGDTPAAKVDATALVAANTAHTDNYGIEVDPTDCPGLYRFDFPDAAFAVGVREVVLTVKHTSCFTESLRVCLDAEVDAAMISKDSTAANNCELMFDGTGYAGGTTKLVIDTSALVPAKNVALSNIEFLMVDATDFATPETGLTVSGTRSIDGAAFGAVTGTIAEVTNGIYQLDASQADMNGTIITFRFTATGAADRFLTIRTTG